MFFKVFFKIFLRWKIFTMNMLKSTLNWILNCWEYKMTFLSSKRPIYLGHRKFKFINKIIKKINNLKNKSKDFIKKLSLWPQPNQQQSISHHIIRHLLIHKKLFFLLMKILKHNYNWKRKMSNNYSKLLINWEDPKWIFNQN